VALSIFDDLEASTTIATVVGGGRDRCWRPHRLLGSNTVCVYRSAAGDEEATPQTELGRPCANTR